MDWRIGKDGFELNAPHRLRPWYNYLSNGDYGLKISHLGDAYATTLAEPRVAVTNYDFFHPCKGRYLYVRDGDDLWTPSFLPCAVPLDSYSCVHAPWSTTYRSSKGGIEAEHQVFLPREGTFELQLVRVSNRGPSRRRVQAVPQMEFLLYASFGVDPVYYSWFTDSRLDADGRTLLFEKRHGQATTGFFRASEAPASFQASLRRFCGDGDPARPQEAAEGRLSGSMCSGDPYAAAFLFDLDLAPGETRTLAIAAGVDRNGALEAARTRFGAVAEVEAELAAVRALWEARLGRDWYDGLKDGPFKAWASTFFGAQIYQQSGGLVRSTYRGFRDVAQDAMGMARFDPGRARELLVQLCSKQYANGRAVRQWNTEGGAPDERDFRDLPFWIPAALSTYERITGDGSIWDAAAPWLDDAAEAPLREHAERGMRYAIRYGDHGLVKMGAGDWNDALSGPGAEGGTTFLNMFAYWALGLHADAAGAHGFDPGFDVEAERSRLYEGVLRYWNGKWFARAVVGEGAAAPAGTVVGGTKEAGSDGRVFLLPLAWFTISGMADRGPEAARIALDTMLAELETETGLLKCRPGYEGWDPAAGNLSALAPGMAENFAVYNHAAAFAAYALFKAGRDGDGLRVLRKILPLYKDWRRTKAEPFVLVNFYNGGFRPEKEGEGGIPWLTGTVNWLALCLWDFVLPRGLQVD